MRLAMRMLGAALPFVAAAGAGADEAGGVPCAPADPAYVERGEASWYGPGFHGRPTANGETFDQNRPSAAHPDLPLGTVVTVTDVETGACVAVRINDRGPFVEGRIIDLSKRAADQLGITDAGTAEVVVTATEEQLATAGEEP